MARRLVRAGAVASAPARARRLRPRERRRRGARREPLAGEMRLAWWREALAGARPTEAAGAPIAAALIDTMAKFALSVSIFENLQALTFDVYDDAMESLEALEGYGIATAGALTALARSARGGARNGRASGERRRGGGARARPRRADFALGDADRCWRRVRDRTPRDSLCRTRARRGAAKACTRRLQNSPTRPKRASTRPRRVSPRCPRACARLRAAGDGAARSQALAPRAPRPSPPPRRGGGNGRSGDGRGGAEAPIPSPIGRGSRRLCSWRCGC